MNLKEYEEAWQKEWKEVCDKVATMGPYGKWISEQILRKLTVGSPVTMGFALICVLVHILTFGGNATFLTRWLSVQDRWDGSSLTQYTCFWTHIIAHSDYGHLKGNLTLLLLVGPSVEFHFGSRNVLWIILLVSLVSALVHILIGRRNTHQLGASGVVFAFILLNSMVTAKHGLIPLSFVFTVALYLGEEFFLLLIPRDNVSHHAHLSGGLVGAAAGFYIHKELQRQKTKKIVQPWFEAATNKKEKSSGGAVPKDTKTRSSLKKKK